MAPTQKDSDSDIPVQHLLSTSIAMDVLSDILSVEQRWIITASLGILSVVGVAAILTRRSRAVSLIEILEFSNALFIQLQANVPELSTPWYLPGIVATLMRGRDMLVESAVKVTLNTRNRNSPDCTDSILAKWLKCPCSRLAQST